MAIKRYAGDRFTGLSTDTKPTNVEDGALFHEVDTRAVFVYNNGWQSQPPPSPPTTYSTTIVGESIEVTFNQSSTVCDKYEVWSSVNNVNFYLIAVIPKQDIAAAMSVLDTSFYTGGTINHRVYAIKNGVYSNALTGSIAFTIPTLDVTDLTVVPQVESFSITYTEPDSRFYNGVEIWVDAQTTTGALSRSNATLIYSGGSDNYVYTVPNGFSDHFHQFWVEVQT